MNSDSLNLQFFKFMNDLLNELTAIYPAYNDIINEKYNELVENHIDEFNNNIKDHIDSITSNNLIYFEDKDIYILEGINIKEIWRSDISDVSKMNILKYLQTLYLLSNFRNKEEKKNDFSKIMDNLKEQVVNDEDMEQEEQEEQDDDSKCVDGKCSTEAKPSEKELNDMSENLKNMFGGGGENNSFNSIASMAQEMAQELEKEDDLDMQNIMKGDQSSLFNMMQKINTKLDKKFKNNEINPADLMKDATSMMQTMSSNPMFSNMMKQATGMDMNQLNRQQKKKI